MGETLLILGLLAGGAWFMWRRGAFARPDALSATGAVPPPAPAPVPPPLIEHSSSALATAPAAVRPPPPPRKEWTPERVAAVQPLAQAAAPMLELAIKPPPVTAHPGVVATVHVANLPNPFGKKPIGVVSTNAPAAKPAPIATPAPPSTKSLLPTLMSGFGR